MIREINAQTGVETTREYNGDELAAINSPERVKERNNSNIQVQISELEAQVSQLILSYILRPNVPISRPSGPPKTPAQVIADIDTKIAALQTKLQ